MNEVSPEKLLLLGKVVRPHGLDGRLRILSYAQSGKSFLNADTIFLKFVSGEIHEYAVSSVKPHKNILILRLKGLNSLDEAEKLKGSDVYLRKDSLVRENEDEFFWYEIIGLQVYLTTGDHIGVIRQIIPTGGNDVYVVREGEKEILIPAIHDVVKEIDLVNKKMIIFGTEGLLDLNEV